ncbi:MAG: hypothetical protein Q4C61_17785 [Lachnospiraceae bacterium]|nr:hypothetical protein [Lachnospiraceae bacterium]
MKWSTRIMSGYENYGAVQLLTAALLLGAVAAGFAAILLWNRWKNRKRLMARIRREWGQEPERQYDPTEFDCISHYYLNRESDGFQIDDITWSDLDMDRVFMQMNHTRSFLGESYLYYRLRTPQTESGELEEFEQLVSWFGTHETEREEMEYFFARIGKTGRSSVFDYIFNLAEADSGSNLIHYGVILLVLCSVGMLFVYPQPGILLLIAAMGVSIGTYEHYKRPVAPYIVSCTALEKVLQAAEQIVKQDVILMKKAEIRKAVSAFKKLRRNMLLLVAGETQGGGLEQSLFIYLNNLFHIDLIQFKTVVKEVSAHMTEFEFLVDEIGRIESAIAVASYRRMLPEHAAPVLHEGGEVRFRAEKMYHPLIVQPVPNSIDMERCVLLTGSNASGKSTFLKTAALQIILAQTIHTALAKEYEACYFRVFSSMALRDDLVGEESYYMVEIRSLKRILDRMKGDVPVFCCVDEVLRGTNTVERIAASSQILKRMAQEKLLCMAATHDIELTYLLEDTYRNCHFEEEVTEDEIRFDYLLKEGRAMTRNAIRLLHMMGFEDSVIQSAEKMAEKLAKQPGR